MRSAHYLKAMGVSVWKSRRTLPFEKKVAPEAQRMSEDLSIFESPIASSVGQQNTEQPSAESTFDETVTPKVVAPAVISWDGLRENMVQCRACDLHHSRSQVVFGVGNRQADWLVIGEAPSVDEDTFGEPFVGAAGQLLNQMLIAIGVSREKVFISSLVRCRTPDNRDPSATEVLSCSKFLERQIELIQPKVILSVGRVATQNLLDKKEPIGKMRGNLYQFGSMNIPLVPTFHPAYLLRSPSEKSKVWSDLVFAKRNLNCQ